MSQNSLQQKLRETIVTHQLVHEGDALVVGVSGGPDSLALLHGLKQLAPEWGLKLFVAHLNHQLRGADADADEQFVLGIAREWGLPVASAQWDVKGYAEEVQLSLEEAARELRYRFLLGVARQVDGHTIAVAHNANDQTETILLHFLRGAGMAGLRGMAYQSELSRDEGEATVLIRPLLDVTRAEIEAYCAENGLEPRVDATNADTTILRNRLRHEVIPYLETLNPNLSEVLRDSARSVADDYDYIQQNVMGIFDHMTRAHEGAFVFNRKWFRALPVNLQRGVLREAVSRVRDLKNVGFTQIEQARRVAVEKDAGAEATLPQGLMLVVGYDEFTIGERLPLPDEPLLLHGEEIVLRVGDVVEIGDWRLEIGGEQGARNEKREGTRWVAEFDAGKLVGDLVLRTRREGEGFAPRGMGGKHKSLHEFMIDEKIPQHLRGFVPILADGEKVLWVVGYRVGEEAAARGGVTERVVRIEFFKGAS